MHSLAYAVQVRPTTTRQPMTTHPTLPDAALADMENEAVRAWRELFSVTAHPIREAVAHVVREGADTLTEDFYSRMQTHARAASFLGCVRPCASG